MTNKQLSQIKSFCKKYYQKTDQFHDWEHPILTTKYAFNLAKHYDNVDYKVLEAACYVHDIGRVKKDEGHSYESARMAAPFLKKIKLTEAEQKAILHAVSVHAMEDIHKAETIEAKLLFDADKIQILSVYGFIRVYSFLLNQRKWKMKKSLDFMWNYIQEVYEKDYLQTKEAKTMLKKEVEMIGKIMEAFNKGLDGSL